MGEIGGNGNHVQAKLRRCVLRDVQGAATADPDQRVIGPTAESHDEIGCRTKCWTGNVDDVGQRQQAVQRPFDEPAVTGSDRNSNPAAGRKVFLIQQFRQTGECSVADLDPQRSGDHRVSGHQADSAARGIPAGNPSTLSAMSRARARSSGVSTSTQGTLPIPTVPTDPPRWTNS